VRAAPFAPAQATRLAELRRQAVEDQAEAELHGPVAGAPVAALRDLVAEDPLREHAWAPLVRALVAAGRPAVALATFERARRTLADDLGADPSPELAAAHTAALHATRGPARPGVPAQLTRFVGRARELRRVAAALAGARLVTLVGPGGAGKTRLAVEAAGRHAGEVCFVLAGRGRRGRRRPYRAGRPWPAGGGPARPRRARPARHRRPAGGRAGRTRPAAGARQLRARDRRGRRAGRPVAGPLPGPAGAGHQPGTPGGHR